MLQGKLMCRCGGVSYGETESVDLLGCGMRYRYIDGFEDQASQDVSAPGARILWRRGTTERRENVASELPLHTARKQRKLPGSDGRYNLRERQRD